MINSSFSLCFSRSVSGASGLCTRAGHWSTCLASNDTFAVNRNVSCSAVPCRLSWKGEWNSLATIVWGDCINLFRSLGRLLGFHVGLLFLWESGQTLRYTTGSALGFVLLTHTTKTYKHQLCLSGVLKAVLLQIKFFSELCSRILD